MLLAPRSACSAPLAKACPPPLAVSRAASAPVWHVGGREHGQIGTETLLCPFHLPAPASVISHDRLISLSCLTQIRLSHVRTLCQSAYHRPARSIARTLPASMTNLYVVAPASCWKMVPGSDLCSAHGLAENLRF